LRVLAILNPFEDSSSSTYLDNMAATKVSPKLFIDKRRQQVLFAEADKKFVDFLFSIFTLPVGAVMSLLKEGGGMVGCLPSLYQSIEDMSVTHIKPDKSKRFLLEPKVMLCPKVPLLLPNIGSTFRQLYRCSNSNKYNTCINYVTDEDSTICPYCELKMNRIVTFVDPPSTIRESSTTKDGYVKGTVIYMVMDNLEVKPLSTTTLVSLFAKFNVMNIGDIEEKVVDVGMDEVCHS
jgi:hypothetical protein